MLNRDHAGKTKNYAALNSIVQEVQTAPVQTKPVETEKTVTEGNTKTIAMASSVVEMVRANADHTIQKKRHAMYKGERLPRTYLIKSDVDLRMRKIAEEKQLKIQGIVEMAIVEYLDRHYPDVK